MSSLSFRLWVIDDRAENQAMIERSLPAAVRPVLELQQFLDARAAIATFDELCAMPERLPDFILLDFFLGRLYGTHVLQHLHAAYRHLSLRPAVIIAHSSMEQANSLMVREGADFALPKDKERPFDEPVAATFANPEALAHLRQQRRPI